MSLHLRSFLKRAALLAGNKNCFDGQKTALSQLASLSIKSQPNCSKFENNIITSPHSDCTLHGMNMVQRFFENAGRWPNKIAMVIFPSSIYSFHIL